MEVPEQHFTAGEVPLGGARWGLFALAQLLLGSALAVFGYRRVFGQFALYDDQGNMMLTLRLWLSGRRLYDEIPTPYGPFYYLIQRLIYRTLAAPLTTDGTRWVCLIYWLLAAVLFGALVYCLTRQFMLALLGQAVLFLFLTLITSEPSHPQEQLLVEMGLLLLAATVRSADGTWMAAGMGSLCACMLLTKVNVGVFATAACGMSILAVSDLRRADAVIRIGASLLAVVIPVRLMIAVWGSEPWTGFTISETASIAILALISFRPDRARIWNAGPLLAFAAAIVVTASAIAAPVWVMGSTIHGFVATTGWMVRQQISAFVFYPLMPADQIRWTIQAVVSALLLGCWPLKNLVRRIAPLLIPAAKIGAGVYGLSLLVPDWDTLYAPSRLPPLAWLLLLPNALPRSGGQERDTRRQDWFPRAALAWMAVLQPMWIFPVGGTQRFPASVVVAVAMIVCLGDGLRDLRAWMPGVAPLAWGAIVPGLFAAASWFSSLYPTLKSYDLQYRYGVPIGLPGAVRTRTNEETAAELRLITRTLSTNCDSFLASDGLNSLYFWTGQLPTTSLVVSHPLEYFTPEQQSQVLESLAGHDRSCFVIERTGFPHETPDMPAFLAHARQYYRPWCRIGFCDLYLRTGRVAPPIPPGASAIPPPSLQHARPHHHKR